MCVSLIVCKGMNKRGNFRQFPRLFLQKYGFGSFVTRSPSMHVNPVKIQLRNDGVFVFSTGIYRQNLKF